MGNGSNTYFDMGGFTPPSDFDMGGALSPPDNTNTSFTDPKVRNPEFNTFPKHLPVDNFIQRGYLRLLGKNLTAVGTGTAESVGSIDAQNSLQEKKNELGAKLNFQFNPSQLTRSVTARTDTQLWINQSPSQLLMPGIGDMTFGWQMLFNREAEVQDNFIARTQQWASRLEVDSSPKSIDALIADFGVDSPQVASRIGVLADIMVLDMITGQRLTEATVRYSQAYAEAVRVRNEEPDENAAIISNMTGSQKDNLQTANMHNSAFLIPNPIRAVFSENFMVDGYVNQVTVSLQKFSPEMVPTVAFVDISMHAIYQGFARDTTVFTALAEALAGQPISSSMDPAAGENQNRIADNVNDESYELQRLGFQSQPRILAGMDHSPDDTGGWAPWSGDAQVHLRDHKATGAPNTTTSLGDLKGGNSKPCQVEDGENEEWAFSYAFCSELKNSDLGDFLLKHPERGEFRDLVLDRFAADVWVGMALRARLKAKGDNDDAKLENLKKLWEDGDEGGFTGYVTGDHFFGEWSPERRKQLFAIGIDNMRTVYGTTFNAKQRQGFHRRAAEQASGFFTRSFPITELSSHPGHYGDEFYRHHGTFNNTEINIKFAGGSEAGWIWMPDKRGRGIPSEEFAYNMARGFYTSSTNLFPTTITLVGTGTTADIEFDVEYQWATTYRVRLLMSDIVSGGTAYCISDTGVIWVNPRNATTDIIDDIDKGLWVNTAAEKDKTLDGSPQGEFGDGIETTMKDGEWLKKDVRTLMPDIEAKDLKLYFDDLFSSGQTPPNSKLYADAKSPGEPVNPRLGGMSISSAGVSVNMNGSAF
jgi:hypothetical protein